MRALIQRVSRAQAFNKDNSIKEVVSIGNGMVILCGFGPQDTLIEIEQLAQKVKALRIFADAQGKMNLSGQDIGAQFLLVSQFTLYADCRYGNRPGFQGAAPKGKAKEGYEHFVATFKRLVGEGNVRSTPFGSDLSLELVNEGPVTLWLDSQSLL